MTNLRCAVTGANGYLGSSIRDYFLSRNVETIALTHKNPAGAEGNERGFALGKPLEPDLFKNIDLLIHCAYDLRQTDWESIRRINIQGTAALFQAAHEAGVKKIVHISTISAFPGCRSLYGKAKLEIEETAKKYGAVILRPGLIYGPRAGGMVGALSKAVAKLPVIPLIGDGHYIQYLVHVDDLCGLIFKMAMSELAEIGTSPITAASQKGLTFKNILVCLSEARRGRAAYFVPVPVFLIWFSLRVIELLGLKMSFRSDSIISLLHQNRHPDFDPVYQGFFREFTPEEVTA